jgi:hypothetical protein
MMKGNVGRWLVVAVLIGVALAGRLLPHPPNFTPVAAAALFAGFFFHDRRLAVCVPLVVMLLGDALIGGYDARVMAVVYAALAVPIVGGAWLRRRLTPIRLFGLATLGSIAFFATTNLAVWAFGGLYPRDAGGFVACYAAAVPFFKYTWLGDLVWTGTLFGVYGLARRPWTGLARVTRSCPRLTGTGQQ